MKHDFIRQDILNCKITKSGRQIICTFSKKLRYTQLKLVSGAQFLNIEQSVQFFYKTMESDVYMKIIQNFITLLEKDEHYAWFQQDEATAHNAEKTMYVLAKFFKDRIISFTAFTHSCSCLASPLARTFVCLCLCANNEYSHVYKHSHVRTHNINRHLSPLTRVRKTALSAGATNGEANNLTNDKANM